MDWTSLIATLFSKSAKSGGGQGMSGGTGGSAGGWFSTSTAASAATGDNILAFGESSPIYNQSLIGALNKMPPEKLAIVGAVFIVGAALAFKLFRGK